MREIEVLYKLHDTIDSAKSKLNQFKFIGSKKTLDIYYYDPLRNELKPNESGKIFQCFRIRSKNGQYSLAYKIDKYNGDEWLYSDEFETVVGSFDSCQEIITNLGLKELIKVDNTKFTYLTDKYEIVLEEVVGLGAFLEVEAKEDDVSVSFELIKDNIRNFVESLGLNIGDEQNSGKPELLLKERNYDSLSS